ncbi:MAG: ribosome-associated translation inhibitor RaiA [bacterium]
MNKKISFKNMPSSAPLEAHASQKLEKIKDFLKDSEDLAPFNIELHLKANKQHPHHRADLSLKTPCFNLNSHDEGTDMYVAIDNAIDRMVALLKKEKQKLKDKSQKQETEKSKFSSDKYKL